MQAKIYACLRDLVVRSVYLSGCSRSNLEIYDGENEKTRYCGILLPGASLQHSSTIFPTEFPNIQGFDIRFTGMLKSETCKQIKYD